MISGNNIENPFLVLPFALGNDKVSVDYSVLMRLQWSYFSNNLVCELAHLREVGDLLKFYEKDCAVCNKSRLS